MNGQYFLARLPIPGVLLAAVCMLLSGCAMTVSHPRALYPLDKFVPLPADSRVLVEPGYEAYGARVAAALPHTCTRGVLANGR